MLLSINVAVFANIGGMLTMEEKIEKLIVVTTFIQDTRVHDNSDNHPDGIHGPTVHPRRFIKQQIRLLRDRELAYPLSMLTLSDLHRFGTTYPSLGQARADKTNYYPPYYILACSLLLSQQIEHILHYVCRVPELLEA